MITTLLKRVKDHWQVLATLLVLFSIFDLYNYYSSFGIDIQHYVNISEILLLAFPTILSGIVSILLIVLFFAIGLRNEKVESDPKIQEMLTAIDEYHSTLFHFKNTFRYLKQDFKPFKFKNLLSITISCIIILLEIGTLLFILSVGYVVYRLFNLETIFLDSPSRRAIFVILSFFTFFFLSPLFMLIDVYFEKYSHKIFSNLTISKNPIIYFLIGLILNSTISNRIQYLSIINGHSNQIVHFTYEGKKIETDSNLVYIGSTHDYLFIRNNNDSLSMIFKKEEIRNLTFRVNRIKR